MGSSDVVLLGGASGHPTILLDHPATQHPQYAGENRPTEALSLGETRPFWGALRGVDRERGNWLSFSRDSGGRMDTAVQTAVSSVSLAEYNVIHSLVETLDECYRVGDAIQNVVGELPP